jgi:hypothetical protein
MDKNINWYLVLAGFFFISTLALWLLLSGMVVNVGFWQKEADFWQEQSEFWHEQHSQEKEQESSTLLYGCIKGCEIEKGTLTIDNHNACILSCREWLK